jgi:hypothetical protein
MSIGRKIFWRQTKIRKAIILANCYQIKIRKAVSIGRKIFWLQIKIRKAIILANCYQIKIRKGHHSRKLLPNQNSQIAIVQAFSQKGRKQEKQEKQSIVS